MSKTSKTARASAVTMVKEKKVIPDEVYIKNLRNDLDSGLYVAQEGARALLRAYDAALADVKQTTETLAGAEEALRNKVIENEALYKNNQALDAELQAALKQVASMCDELIVLEKSANEDGPLAPCGCEGGHSSSCVLSRRSDG